MDIGWKAVGTGTSNRHGERGASCVWGALWASIDVGNGERTVSGQRLVEKAEGSLWQYAPKSLQLEDKTSA